MLDDLFNSCIRGAGAVHEVANDLLNESIGKNGADAPLQYPETMYELPVVYSLTNLEAKTLGSAADVLDLARNLIGQEPTAENAMNAGVATLLCAEVLEALKYENGNPYPAPAVGFVPDSILRQLGIFMVDGSVPGVVVVIGKADDPTASAAMIRNFQEIGLLIFLAGDCIHQMEEEGIKLGETFRTFPLGPLSAVINAVNFAVRAGLIFGNIGRGQSEAILEYLNTRVKAFVCALGQLDDVALAIAAGVMKAGLTVVSDQPVPEIDGALLSRPVGESMVNAGMEAQGIKVKMVKTPIPIAFGPAYEGERIRKPDTFVEFGGGRSAAFELVISAPVGEVKDREVTVVGPDVSDVSKGSVLPLALRVTVAGKKMQKDFESVLERRIHRIVNYGEGTMHIAQRDTTWIRISDEAVEKGFSLKDLGMMVISKIHSDFENIVDRVSVSISTEDETVQKALIEARKVYAERDARAKTLTDDAVEEFYSCTLCQSFAPNHVCIVTPERLGLCGAINWLDGKAGYEITPTGPNQPVPKGALIDAVKGSWEQVNAFVFENSRNTIEGFNLYSIMEQPMTSCGCFECILAIIPEANGFMVVNREFAGSETPCGMGFSTLAVSVSGGVQVPGFMGIGKQYLLSKKFISAEGGLPRLLWIPSELKEQLGPGLKRRSEEIGIPDLFDKIADETVAVTLDQLLEYLTRTKHPALQMEALL